ncbi:MAG: RibD family protein [Methylococcaceae bacterium]|nr:MAG: RibD family protein [Methylococcaceae bacterium]
MQHLLSPKLKQKGLAEFDFIQPLLHRMAAHERAAGALPFVTLSYAQSLDGSIAIRRYHACALSSGDSLRLTHFLRARHAALLVGINTIIADDPQLTVRLCHGESPLPVILDSSLRFPLDAALLKAAAQPPIIVTSTTADEAKIQALLQRGAQVLRVPQNAHGRLELDAALRLLKRQGLRSVMVEGGGTVINQFLREQRVDYCVITVVPKLIGGFKAVGELCLTPEREPLAIADCRYHALGTDMIVHGSLGAG